MRPKPVNATKASIHKFAERAAAALDFAPRDPIKGLVRRLGGEIVYRSADQDNPERLPESIIVRSTKDFTIYLPTMTSRERDRFTIAHELGHLFLHYPLIAKANPLSVMAATRWVDEKDSEQQRAEWEANWFAAAFLMPAELFRQALDEWDDDIAMVASEFGVSTKAAEIRKKTL